MSLVVALAGGLMLIPVAPAAAGKGGTPKTGRIICSPNEINAETPQIAARADGVHVMVDHSFNRPAKLYALGSDGTGHLSDPIPPGGAVVTFPYLAPGTVELACVSTTPTPDEYPKRPRAWAEVVDPGHRWVPAVLSCPGGAIVVTSPHPDRKPEEGPLLEIAMEDFHRSMSVEPNDWVGRSGYPRSRAEHQADESITLVRDGVGIGRSSYERRSDGWLFWSMAYCLDL